MRRLFQLVLRFHAFLIFLILQVVAIGLLIRTNHFHYSRFFSSSSKIVGNIMEKRMQISEYFRYDEINQDLAEQITQNLNENPRAFQRIGNSDFFEVEDTVYMQKWQYTSAHIVNKSVGRLQNYITLDKGLSNGLKKDMGVVYNNKIVGVVKNVSDNFAVVLPVINDQFKTSVRHKNSMDFGTMEDWDGIDPGYSYVYGIPSTVEILPGDSILTSGLSVLFPENLVVGVVDQVEHSDAADTYVLRVELATDFYSLSHVQVIGNLLKIEQEDLESEFEENDS